MLRIIAGPRSDIRKIRPPCYLKILRFDKLLLLPQRPAICKHEKLHARRQMKSLTIQTGAGRIKRIERKKMSAPINVGIVGAGYISAAYLRGARYFPELAIVSCADAQRANAEKRGEEFGLKVQEVDELVHNPAIELVLNLTTPQSHARISSQAL